MNRIIKLLSTTVIAIAIFASSAVTIHAGCQSVWISSGGNPIPSSNLIAHVEYALRLDNCILTDSPDSYTAILTLEGGESRTLQPFTQWPNTSDGYITGIFVTETGNYSVSVFEDGVEIFNGDGGGGGPGANPDDNRLEGLGCDVTEGNFTSEGLRTGLGCIPFGNTNVLAIFAVRWGLGVVGGFAFLLIVYASVKIMSSSGDPKKLQEGKTILYAAISGLILAILTVFILRMLGVNILGLF